MPKECPHIRHKVKKAKEIKVGNKLFLALKHEEMWSCGPFWSWGNLFDKGAPEKKKKKYTKWKKEEANENILREQKPHGMRKVRETHEQNSKRARLGSEGKKVAEVKAWSSFAFSLETDPP